MHRPLLQGLVVLIMVAMLFGVAQDSGEAAASDVDADLLSRGQELYDANCAVCHGADGTGSPPTFPALAGNERLADASLIVRNVHQGRNAMPAFPRLSAEDIAAVATYVRSSWGNEFGAVDIDQVEQQVAELDSPDVAELRSVWDGVYTPDQADRGDVAYSGNCSSCHGFLWISGVFESNSVAERVPSDGRVLMHITDPAAGPPLDGPAFLEKWDGLSVGVLYEFARTTMPQLSPGSLENQEYADILAFLFAVNGMPPGDEELVPDLEVLNSIIIESEPSE